MSDPWHALAADFMIAFENSVVGPEHFASLAIVVTVVQIYPSDPVLAHELSFACVGVRHWCYAMLTTMVAVTVAACYFLNIVLLRLWLLLLLALASSYHLCCRLPGLHSACIIAVIHQKVYSFSAWHGSTCMQVCLQWAGG